MHCDLGPLCWSCASGVLLCCVTDLCILWSCPVTCLSVLGGGRAGCKHPCRVMERALLAPSEGAPRRGGLSARGSLSRAVSKLPREINANVTWGPGSSCSIGYALGTRAQHAPYSLVAGERIFSGRIKTFSLCVLRATSGSLSGGGQLPGGFPRRDITNMPRGQGGKVQRRKPGRNYPHTPQVMPRMGSTSSSCSGVQACGRCAILLALGPLLHGDA